ncbi:nose resistant to fluoxetine protein 6-like isoform X2 [Tachypleus tridentatus]|uniref:nose resistant to fluoxetine protein 6-like isoform X2 n=1 Tax=Tachypleus tridentatus TaxID=6853 RepID=UPI003FD37712
MVCYYFNINEKSDSTLEEMQMGTLRMMWIFAASLFLRFSETPGQNTSEFNDTTNAIGTATERFSPAPNHPWTLSAEKVIDLWNRMDKDYRKIASYWIEKIKPAVEHVLATANVTDLCRESVLNVLDSISGLETWAIKMLDATGKLPAGLLEGSLTSLGSYDECININSSPGTDQQIITGQYCSVQFRPFLPKRKYKYYSIVVRPESLTNVSQQGRMLYDIAQNAQFFYSFSYRLGVCLPSACSRTDVFKATSLVAKTLKLRGDFISCETKTGFTITSEQLFIMLFLGCYAGILLLGTIIDVYSILWATRKVSTVFKPEGLPVQLLKSCSVYSNTKKLFETRSSGHMMSVVSGMKVLAILWVILGHTGFRNHLFLMNRLYTIKDHAVDITKQILFNGSINVDTFFCITGFLTVHTVWTWTEGSYTHFSVPLYILVRYFRLVTPLTLLLLLTFLMPLIGSGPLWSETITPVVDKCRQYWWTNLLFVQNLVKPVQCHSHTWYIACDFQFHVLAVAVFLPLLWKPVLGLAIILTFAIVSVASSIFITWYYQFPPTLLWPVIHKRELWDMLSKLYYQPHHHLSTYCVGLVAGYILIRKRHLNLSLPVQIAGWTLAACSNMISLYGVYNWSRGVGDSQTVGLLYSGLHRTLWAAGIAWILVACISGKGGIISQLLSWNGMKVLDRLTYMVYLLHPLVQYAYIGQLRHNTDARAITFLYMYFGHVIISYVLAGFGVVLFEIPLMRIQKLLLLQRNGQRVPDDGREVRHD